MYQDQGMQEQDQGTVALDDTYADESYDYGQYGDGSYDDGSGMIDPNTGMPLAGGADGNKDLDQAIRSKMINLGGGIWQCTDCELKTKSSNLYNHVEAKHLAEHSGYHCVYCQKFCKTRHSLITHTQRFHKKNKDCSPFIL